MKYCNFLALRKVMRNLITFLNALLLFFWTLRKTASARRAVIAVLDFEASMKKFFKKISTLSVSEFIAEISGHCSFFIFDRFGIDVEHQSAEHSIINLHYFS